MRERVWRCREISDENYELRAENERLRDALMEFVVLMKG